MASVTISLRLHDGVIRDLFESDNGPVGLDLIRRGNRVQNKARRNAPKDTTALARSITASPPQRGQGGLFIRVGSGLPYALPQEEGTGPIYPIRGKYLVWPAKNNSGKGRRRYAGGRTSNLVFARKTRGVPAKHYLRDSIDAAR